MLRFFILFCIFSQSVSALAAGGTRGCETTKITMRATYVVERNGGIVKQRDYAIGISTRDVYVRIRAHIKGSQWRRRAKMLACTRVTFDTLDLLIKNHHPSGFKGVVVEKVDRKPNMINWTRAIACQYAKANKVSGVRYRNNNRVRLLSLRFDVEAKHKPSGFRKTDTLTTRISNYYCWKPVRTNP